MSSSTPGPTADVSVRVGWADDVAVLPEGQGARVLDAAYIAPEGG